MSAPLLRVAVVGATGALGAELLDQLRERRFPIRELRAIATERSLGEIARGIENSGVVCIEMHVGRGKVVFQLLE